MANVMTVRHVSPFHECVAEVALRVETRIRGLLESERRRWVPCRPELGHLFDAVNEAVLGGGKRMRPALCFWGFLGAGGHPADEAVISAGAALELLHAFALVHDDVMDGSDIRRGRPAAHRRFAGQHRVAGWRGDPDRFGTGMAVLVGDLAFVYADVLMAGLPAQARRLWQELRVELTMGQHLDVIGAAVGDHDTARACWVASYKSGRYSVERPLHLGAALVGLFDELAPGYSRFGGPVGEAFQLRDDVLGVFGDADVIGKPVGSDLREGKPTLLFALATERAGAAGSSILRRAGQPDMDEGDVGRIRCLMVDCGALAAVEAAIDARIEHALVALEFLNLPVVVSAALGELAQSAAWRDR